MDLSIDWIVLTHLFWIIPAKVLFDIISTIWGFERSEAWINKNYRQFRLISWRDQFVLELPRFIINMTINVLAITYLFTENSYEWIMIQVISSTFMFFFGFYTFDRETKKRIKRDDAKVALEGKDITKLTKAELQMFLDIQGIKYGDASKAKQEKQNAKIEKQRKEQEAKQKAMIAKLKAKGKDYEIDETVSKKELVKLVETTLNQNKK